MSCRIHSIKQERVMDNITPIDIDNDKDRVRPFISAGFPRIGIV